MALIMASQAGLILSQSRGKYFVFHSYGSPLENYRNEVLYIKSKTEAGDRLLALPSLAYSTGRSLVHGLNHSTWDQPEMLAGLLIRENPAAVIYGFDTHSFAQMTEVFQDKKLMGILAEGYEKTEFGDQEVWTRKKRLK